MNRVPVFDGCRVCHGMSLCSFSECPLMRNMDCLEHLLDCPWNFGISPEIWGVPIDFPLNHRENEDFTMGH